MHLRDLTQFLAELTENNNRAWFVMNKPRYDILRAEFLTLVTQLIADLARVDPLVANCNPKKALFRINRDLRFSHQKVPYKTTFSAAITASGLKKPSQGGGPAYYFQIDAHGMFLVAGGEYLPPAERLRVIRQQVVTDPSGFDQVLKDKKFQVRFGNLRQDDKLIRPPKGFPVDVPHADYLKLKSFIASQQDSLDITRPDQLGPALAQAFLDVQPLVRWLRQAQPAA